jgi:ABC-type multidrug transport system permease subunit
VLELEELIKALNQTEQRAKHKEPARDYGGERLELQRQRIELQRQRFELEKAKHEQRQTKNTATGGAEIIIYMITTLLSFSTLFILIFILSKILKY